jgi:ssDNA-binding replication factor A large subunit
VLFAPIVKQNRVYTFTGGKVAIANKKFSTLKNDYCLTFDKNA